ncbi:uncharacterized membrane protein HdeD (DUF308 family) [Neorhizobium alkalisoli]|uniref:Uncharacterized membrane protein HdeD (DUF308 family) n=2 Tax=Neorhizobium alkalisoli TaxID=528178 RepID=A0A561R364_9HYPH|nr:uncharacterized membrane protein HdeD (DUF308 family) [Neorhizobium alkalisoli]
MTSQSTTSTGSSTAKNAGNNAGSWLRSYYFTRGAFSVAWVAAAFATGSNFGPVTAVLLVGYPLWDAAANLVDARRNGGLGKNPTQTLNVFVSTLTAAAVAIGLGYGMNAVLAVFGAWAIFSGLLQLATGVRRWKIAGAQWAMILSGAQSSLAGAHFIVKATGDTVPSIVDIAPYAAFGAFYFLVSAISLSISAYRARRSA